MSDTTFFLIFVTVSVLLVIYIAYQLLNRRGHVKKRKRRVDGEAHRTAQILKNELEEDENDVVANPVYSFLKINLFNKDRYED